MSNKIVIAFSDMEDPNDFLLADTIFSCNLCFTTLCKAYDAAFTFDGYSAAVRLVCPYCGHSTGLRYNARLARPDEDVPTFQVANSIHGQPVVMFDVRSDMFAVLPVTSNAIAKFSAFRATAQALAIAAHKDMTCELPDSIVFDNLEDLQITFIPSRLIRGLSNQLDEFEDEGFMSGNSWHERLLDGYTMALPPGVNVIDTFGIHANDLRQYQEEVYNHQILARVRLNRDKLHSIYTFYFRIIAQRTIPGDSYEDNETTHELTSNDFTLPDLQIVLRGELMPRQSDKVELPHR